MLASGLEAQISEWFLTYAYEPQTVYLSLLVLMYASSFGLPLPEEILIFSSGIVAHIAANPQLYPPPEGAGPGVDLYFITALCFFAVFTSDLVVYFLGRTLGPRLLRMRWFRRLIGPELIQKTLGWMSRYGFWASGLFRFTPGLRFPGHLACGITRVPLLKFIAVDGSAALLSVPTQILLIGIYGESVIQTLKEFKVVLIFIFSALLLTLIYRWAQKRWFATSHTS